MGCYHPLLAIPMAETVGHGEKEYTRLHPMIIGSVDNLSGKVIRRTINHEERTFDFREVDLGVLPDEQFVEYMKLPCGHCIGCRLDYSRQWADRMMMELQHTGKGIFVTLTYSPESLNGAEQFVSQFLPEDGCFEKDGQKIPMISLNKRDVQLFMKRLRKWFSDREIRFYASGEYGENTHRKHIHLIIFGLERKDVTCEGQFVKFNKFGDRLYASYKLENKIWKKGMVRVSDVSWKTCAYVARYVLKKQYGETRSAWSEEGIEQEFSLMSRRPGIGSFWFEDRGEDIDWNSLQVHYLSDELGNVRRISTPKYFLNKLAKQDPILYNKIAPDRRRFVNDRELLKIQQTDLHEVEVMERDERNHKKAVPVLIRELDNCL